MSRHSKLYNSRRWRVRRAEQLRLQPLCAMCLHAGRITAATVADHVTAHRGDPVLFEGPLASLCTPCHSSTKQREEATGRVYGCDVNGFPLDPRHHWNRPEGGPLEAQKPALREPAAQPHSHKRQTDGKRGMD